MIVFARHAKYNVHQSALLVHLHALQHVLHVRYLNVGPHVHLLDVHLPVRLALSLVQRNQILIFPVIQVLSPVEMALVSKLSQNHVATEICVFIKHVMTV